MLARLCNKNRKNAEYLVKKKTYELVKGLIISSAGILFQQTVVLASHFCYSQDSKLLLWCSGVVSFLRKKLDEQLLAASGQSQQQ